MADLAPEDLVTLPDAPGIKARLTALCLAADPPLPVTAWELGGPSERWMDIVPRAIDAELSGITTQAVRGFFFDLATDPGDPGDTSPDQTPRPGFLSALGLGWYHTERGKQTYATTTTLILTNTSGHTVTFSPYDLTFHRSTQAANGSYPSYRNTPDDTIYTNIDGSVTIGIGGTLTIPIIAEQIGSVANATPGQISVLVTQTYGSMTCTNSASAIGGEREDRLLYIARCKQAADAASPAGAANAYRRAATTASDGTPLQRYDGSGPVGITRVWVTPSSSDSTVDAYFADDDGPADAVDVASADANITGTVRGVILTPTGVVPLGSTTYTGAAAVATNIGPLVGTAKISAVPGQSNADLLAAVHEAIDTKLATTFSTYSIGGLDQVAGAGTIYRSDLADDVRDAYPGLRAVALSTPSGDTAIDLGHVAVLVGLPAVTGAADNGSGAVRLTLASSISGLLSTSDTIQVTGIKGTTEANGTWVITVASTTTIDLQTSVFSNAWTSGGILSRIIVTVS